MKGYLAMVDSGFGKLTDKVENQHNFIQMGRVTVGGLELPFEIGSTALPVE